MERTFLFTGGHAVGMTPIQNSLEGGLYKFTGRNCAQKIATVECNWPLFRVKKHNCGGPFASAAAGHVMLQ